MDWQTNNYEFDEQIPDYAIDWCGINLNCITTFLNIFFSIEKINWFSERYEFLFYKKPYSNKEK